LTPGGVCNTLRLVTATSLISLKQQLARLTEKERQEVSAFLIRRGYDSAEWKRETARRLKAMDSGRKTSVAELRRRLGHAK
jgi:hypothetical protein